MKQIKRVAAFVLAAALTGASAQDWDDDYEDYEDYESYEQAPAAIKLQVCNESGRKATVAVSYMPVGEDRFINRGWFEVEAGACNLIAETGNANFYFYGDTLDGSGRAWQGSHSLCVEYPGPYTFYSTSSTVCSEGQVTRNFVTMSRTEPGTFTWTLSP
jgi:uncharacterized membrane protein